MADVVCKEKIEKIIFAHLLTKYLKQLISKGVQDAD